MGPSLERAIEFVERMVDTSITGLRVQAVLDRLADVRGLPMSGDTVI
jgi:hypothetical protein